MRARVFIVEDDLDTLELIETICQSLGCEVVGRSMNGTDAFRQFMALPSYPDLVVMDYQLPGRDGLQVAQAIRAEDPLVQVLACSCHPESAAAFSVLDRCDFIRKPFCISDFKRLVRAALEQTSFALRGCLPLAV